MKLTYIIQVSPPYPFHIFTHSHSNLKYLFLLYNKIIGTEAHIIKKLLRTFSGIGDD